MNHYIKSGVYTITSPSGKQYVGSSMEIRKRQNRHNNNLRKGAHHSPALQRAYDKYGEEAMLFSVLLFCEPSQLLFYEQRAIDILRPEYNVCRVAGSALGVTRPTETRQRNAEANWLSNADPERKRNRLDAIVAAYADPEVRAKVSASWLNKDTVEARATRHAVSVRLGNSTFDYGSVVSAFTDLNLPIGSHKNFRVKLKRSGREVFCFEGVDYDFRLVEAPDA